MPDQNGTMIPLTINGNGDTAWVRPVPLSQQGQQGYTGLFGPGSPILPIRPEEEPRIFQYQPGINLVTIPRAGFGLIPFSTLRALAATCWQIRLNIELIKREIRALDWEIGAAMDKDPAADSYAAEIDQTKEYFEHMSGYKSFDAFLNAMIEEIFVTDALTLWPEDNMADVSLVDGTTIRPLLDFRGRIPTPPIPGYTQILYGMPTSYFTSDRLLYLPYNVSVDSPYGSTPIEMIILIVNLALRRDTYRIGYFTEGNVPEALVGVPSSWTTNQVQTWQSYWDAMVQGNISEQRKIHFMPLEGGRGQVPVFEFRKSSDETIVFDEWLFKIACWACGNSPSEWGLVDGAGLGGAGYASGMENVQYRSMFGPMTQFITRICNTIIQQWLGKPHLKYQFQGIEPQADKLQQAQVDQIYIASGVYGPGYVQDRESIPEEFRPEAAPADTFTWPGLGEIEPTVEPVTVPLEVNVGKFFQGPNFKGYG